jgi:murein L,D-transpeptidase YafK
MAKKVFIIVFILFSLSARAQIRNTDTKPEDAKAATKPNNVKLVNEYKDDKGNSIRIIEYDQNHMHVTETVIIPPKRTLTVNLHRAINPDTLNKDSVMIKVYKSKYLVEVYYKNKPIRAYKAVFGPRPDVDKCMEGDRCTPEGCFRINMKNPASQYHRFLQLDYPNDSSLVRFNALRKAGTIPLTAKTGGNVGIHGVWNGGDDLVDLGVGWTDGCIALKNKDIEELFSFVSVGAKVFIRK